MSASVQQASAFPSTRYQGSKAKLSEWIWSQISGLFFDTCLDAFGGTGAVSYRLKQAGKCVTYNDVLRFNALIGTALIENSTAHLRDAHVEQVLNPETGLTYPDFVQRTFHGIYYTDDENAWIDRTVTHIRQIGDAAQQALAYYALFQACLVKRPFNLFHRRNLYLRFADVQRRFGNKTSWDRPFDQWFRQYAREADCAVFDNGRANRALNMDAADVPDGYDLVYIDPPYLSARGAGVDYRGFYHFLEGLASYDDWEAQIDTHSLHRRLMPHDSPWNDRARNYAAFEQLVVRHRRSILVVSYRDDGIPSIDELATLLRQHKREVRIAHYGRYQYALSRNRQSREALLIAM